MKRRIWALAAFVGTALAGCGFGKAQAVGAPSPKPHPAYHTVWMPQFSWYPISVGPPVLLAEGAQVSSVLAGPQGRLYYGTANPLGNADTIGWYDPKTRVNHWTSVPAVNPPFPKNSDMGTLNVQQSASWGGVDLVVSGQHNVWYRHWGYVGGWSAVNGKFVPGDYAIPGPTVTAGQWTASAATTFSGLTDIKLMNLNTHQVVTRNVPSNTLPVALAITGSQGSTPTVWMISSQTVWMLNGLSTVWQPVASLSSNDFFVAMGRWGHVLWTVDANGNIDRISLLAGLVPIATVPASPLAAVSAPENGLWISSPHHILLWVPHQPLKRWIEPTSPYPAPASTWATTGTNEPPDWPPVAQISAGPAETVIIGEGTWLGVARLVPERVPVHGKGAAS